MSSPLVLATDKVSYVTLASRGFMEAPLDVDDDVHMTLGMELDLNLLTTSTPLKTTGDRKINVEEDAVLGAIKDALRNGDGFVNSNTHAKGLSNFNFFKKDGDEVDPLQLYQKENQEETGSLKDIMEQEIKSMIMDSAGISTSDGALPLSITTKEGVVEVWLNREEGGIEGNTSASGDFYKNFLHAFLNTTQLEDLLRGSIAMNLVNTPQPSRMLSGGLDTSEESVPQFSDAYYNRKDMLKLAVSLRQDFNQRFTSYLKLREGDTWIFRMGVQVAEYDSTSSPETRVYRFMIRQTDTKINGLTVTKQGPNGVDDDLNRRLTFTAQKPTHAFNTAYTYYNGFVNNIGLQLEGADYQAPFVEGDTLFHTGKALDFTGNSDAGRNEVGLHDGFMCALFPVNNVDMENLNRPIFAAAQASIKEQNKIGVILSLPAIKDLDAQTSHYLHGDGKCLVVPVQYWNKACAAPDSVTRASKIKEHIMDRREEFPTCHVRVQTGSGAVFQLKFDAHADDSHANADNDIAHLNKLTSVRLTHVGSNYESTPDLSNADVALMERYYKIDLRDANGHVANDGDLLDSDIAAHGDKKSFAQFIMEKYGVATNGTWYPRASPETPNAEVLYDATYRSIYFQDPSDISVHVGFGDLGCKYVSISDTVELPLFHNQEMGQPTEGSSLSQPSSSIYAHTLQTSQVMDLIPGVDDAEGHTTTYDLSPYLGKEIAFVNQSNPAQSETSISVPAVLSDNSAREAFALLVQQKLDTNGSYVGVVVTHVAESDSIVFDLSANPDDIVIIARTSIHPVRFDLPPINNDLKVLWPPQKSLLASNENFKPYQNVFHATLQYDAIKGYVTQGGAGERGNYHKHTSDSIAFDTDAPDISTDIYRNKQKQLLDGGLDKTQPFLAGTSIYQHLSMKQRYRNTRSVLLVPVVFTGDAAKTVVDKQAETPTLFNYICLPYVSSGTTASRKVAMIVFVLTGTEVENIINDPVISNIQSEYGLSSNSDVIPVIVPLIGSDLTGTSWANTVLPHIQAEMNTALSNASLNMTATITDDGDVRIDLTENNDYLFRLPFHYDNTPQKSTIFRIEGHSDISEIDYRQKVLLQSETIPEDEVGDSLQGVVTISIPDDLLLSDERIRIFLTPTDAGATSITRVFDGDGFIGNLVTDLDAIDGFSASSTGNTIEITGPVLTIVELHRESYIPPGIESWAMVSHGFQFNTLSGPGLIALPESERALYPKCELNQDKTQYTVTLLDVEQSTDTITFEVTHDGQLQVATGQEAFSTDVKAEAGPSSRIIDYEFQVVLKHVKDLSVDKIQFNSNVLSVIEDSKTIRLEVNYSTPHDEDQHNLSTQDINEFMQEVTAVYDWLNFEPISDLVLNAGDSPFATEEYPLQQTDGLATKVTLEYKFDSDKNMLTELRQRAKELEEQSSALVKPVIEDAYLRLERNFLNFNMLKRVRKSMDSLVSTTVSYAFFGEIGVDTLNGKVSLSHDDAIVLIGESGANLKLTLTDHNLTYAPANAPLDRPGAFVYANRVQGMHGDSEMGTSLLGFTENPQTGDVVESKERVYFLRSIFCESVNEKVEDTHMIKYDRSHYHDGSDFQNNHYKSLPLVGNIENRVLWQFPP